jgi:hypothetical protein
MCTVFQKISTTMTGAILMQKAQTSPPNFRNLTQDELEALAPTLSLDSLPDATKDKIRMAISEYLAAWDSSAPESPSQPDVDNLKAFNGQVSAFRDAVAGLKPSDLAAMKFVDPAISDVLADIADRLSNVETVLTTAIASGVRAGCSDGGSDPDGPLHSLIHALMKVYEQETEKEAGNSWDPVSDAYFGPFFDLTSAVIRIAAPDVSLSNRALGSKITKALASARQRYGDFLMRSHGRSSGIRIETKKP